MVNGNFMFIKPPQRTYCLCHGTRSPITVYLSYRFALTQQMMKRRKARALNTTNNLFKIGVNHHRTLCPLIFLCIILSLFSISLLGLLVPQMRDTVSYDLDIKSYKLPFTYPK
jgi:hypothetical protein